VKLTRILRAFFLIAALCSAAISHAADSYKLLVRDAVIVTMDASATKPYVGYIAVGSDGRIAALGEGEPDTAIRARRTVDGTDMIVMPGFVSGHSHLSASVRRGRLPDKELDGLIDNPVPFFLAEHYRKGDLHAFALHGAVDYLRNGITSAFEYPIRPRDLSETLYKEMLAAELESGMRIVYGYNVPDLPPEQAREAFVAFKAYAENSANPTLVC
jgi:cytosine/adenosine deaminase-related metal-dependent hydrolase